MAMVLRSRDTLASRLAVAGATAGTPFTLAAAVPIATFPPRQFAVFYKVEQMESSKFRPGRASNLRFAPGGGGGWGRPPSGVPGS